MKLFKIALAAAITISTVYAKEKKYLLLKEKIRHLQQLKMMPKIQES